MTDYWRAARQSILKDFGGRYERKEPQRPAPKDDDTRRIVSVGERSSYFRYRSYIVGRLVRVKSKADTGGWICEFVREADRKALNAAAGWTMKREYLFDCVKFD